jgi:YihY family inner membrane protein
MASRLHSIIDSALGFLSEIPGILKKAAVSFQKQEVGKGAAGMAYYTLFSLFPLLIVLITVISYFVDAEVAVSQVTQAVMSVFPVSQGLVERNIERSFQIRNSIGAIGLIGLLWAGSNAFSMMVHNINSAWPPSERRSFFEKRLFGLAMVILLVIVLFLLMLSSTVFNIILRYQQEYLNVDPQVRYGLIQWGSRLIHLIVPFLFFYFLYRVIPMGRVPVKAAGFSALLTTVLWRSASSLFQWYLRSGLARYEVIFGSLSAIIVLLFWIYISSVILFFGAHICAASSGKIPDFKKQD